MFFVKRASKDYTFFLLLKKFSPSHISFNNWCLKTNYFKSLLIFHSSSNVIFQKVIQMLTIIQQQQNVSPLNQYIKCWECCPSCSCSYYSVTFLPHPRVIFVWLWDLDLLTVLSVDVKDLVYVTCNCLYMGMYVCMCYFSVILVLF